MILNDDQAKVYSGIIEAINDNKSELISLTGHAGTGKTTVTSEIIKYFTENTNFTIYITAPTHKAVNVLKDMVDRLNINKNTIKVCTIHSFLKLKLENSYDTGLTKLMPDLNNNNHNKADLLIIDEASMISFELLEHIEKNTLNGNIKKCLFIGDKNQLPPVDDNIDMPLFHIESDFCLDKIVRQAKDNTIIALADKLRKYIISKDYTDFFNIFENISPEDKFIKTFTSKKAFFADYFASDCEDKIVTTYTNNTVNYYNAGIRGVVKGKDIPYIHKGDLLVLQESVVKGKDNIIYRNGYYFSVDSAEKQLDSKNDIYYWKVKNAENNEPDIRVVDIDSLADYKKVLKMKSDLASSQKDRNLRKSLWQSFFSYKQSFVDVKYHYASSIHKLQGSTYGEVYIDFNEISKASAYQDYDMLYRLIYVALTRSSGKVKVLL